MTEKEDIGDLYREATDSTRSPVRVRHQATKRNRVKPDPEDNPWALLDWKEWAILGDAPWFWSE